MGDFRRKKADRKLPRFGVYDIETDIKDDSLVACGFFDGVNYYCFEGKDCVKKFIRFVFRPKYSGYHVYAHNGGRFDTSFLLPAFHELGIPTGSCYTGGRMIILDTLNPHKQIMFNDSYALMQGKLYDLLKSFGVAHQKGSIDFSTIRESDAWIPYLENDVLGLYELLDIFHRFYRPWNVGLGITISQQSMATFRRTINYSIPSYPECEWFIKMGYFGGRVESFKRYGENLFYYDVNSLYPSVMHDFDMPVGNPIHVKGDHYADDEIGFARATVKAPDDLHIPVLPYNNGKLVFPLGRFTGVWDVIELRKAQDKGYHVDFHNGVKFGTMPMFKDFIDKFYKMKEDNRGNAPVFTISKSTMTNLYGKFCESREKETIVMFPEQTAGLTPVNETLGIYSMATYSRSSHILPAIGTHVTALARMRMYGLIEKAGMRNVYYMDTDSLLTSCEMEASKSLGGLKLEHNVKKAYMIAPKFYMIQTPTDAVVHTPDMPMEMHMKDIVKIKGFPKKQFSEVSFRKALVNDLSDFHYDEKVFGLTRENIRRYGRFIGRIDKRKQIKSLYDKRVVCRNHIDTKPLIIRNSC